MNILIHWLLNHILFSSTLFFAAGAPTLTDAGAADLGDPGASSDSGVTDLGYGDDTGTDDAALDETTDGTEKVAEPKIETPKEEPELAEFKGSVSARLRNLTKQAPELTQVFQKYPKLQEQIEATFRREAALREVFPTVAEARQMREHFPNGLQDVQQLMTDVQEVETLDRDFYDRDRDGNYTGHSQLLNNMFSDDREATVALFKTLPKEWARLDPQSYNEVMGSIVGATLQSKGVPEFIEDLLGAAKEAKNPGLSDGLGKLLNWALGFTKEKGKPTADEERLANDRTAFNREKQERAKEDGQRFHSTFVSQSRKLQLDVINNHPAMKRLEKVQGITPEKRSRIADEIRTRMEKLLGKSPSFMRKLRPAYDSRNMEETVKLQRAAWSQPWLLNKMVRDVLRVETPAMVSSNRETAARRAGAPAVRTSAQPGVQQQKGPRQINGVWYKEDGSRFTTAEVIAGKHIAQ